MEIEKSIICNELNLPYRDKKLKERVPFGKY